MSAPRPSTATSGRFASGSRPQFGESGSGSRHQFPPFEADNNHRSNPNSRAGFGSGQRPRPQSYHAQIHQDDPQQPYIHHLPPPGAPAQIRSSVGRTFPSDIGQGLSGAGQHPGGPRASSISAQSAQLPITRYVCFQKKPNKSLWKNEWETCDHITMSIAPEETERQIRRHDEPGKDLGTSISRLGKYQIRHLRKHEDKLNAGERGGWKWVVSAVGKEKNPGGSSQTFWAIYSREPRVRPTNTSLKPLTRTQTFAYSAKTTPRHEDPAYDGPIVVQSVEIPAPPRPGAFPGARPSTAGAGGYTSGQYFANGFVSEAFPAPAAPVQPPVQSTSAGFGPLPGPQLHEVSPGRHAKLPQFLSSGSHIREVDPGRATSFSQFRSPEQPADTFLRSINRTQPVVEAQNFGYQQPHSAEPRLPVSRMSSMPAAPIHRQQSNRVDQPFQPEAKRSPRRSDIRPAIKHPSPQQEQRRRRSNSMAARTRQERPDIHYNDHVDTGKNRRSTFDLPAYSEDKMDRTDRWVESSISGSSGTGTSAVGSGDGGSVVSEYAHVLNPPPMGRRRDSASTYAGDYYTNSSAGLTRGRSFNEGARPRRSIAKDYYNDSRPTAPSRRATQDYDLQYAINTQSRQPHKYVGYHSASRRRSPSRKRSRSRHHGGRDSDHEDYEYESAGETVEATGHLRVNNSTTRRRPSRPGSQYRDLRGLVEFGR